MKYILLSDLHVGNLSNSTEYNNQCLNFLDFVNDKTENMDIDGCIFLGDYFHNRNTINVKTLQCGMEGLYKLGNIGRGNTYMLLGNHDLYYRDRRDVHSIVIPEGDIGVNVIQEPFLLDNMLLCPWLIGEENLKDLIKKYNPEYVFCHVELASFPLNAVSKFEGVLDLNDYEGPRRIMSGHFHTRSSKGNIDYIGACFSHNFSDVNDWHNRGFAILDTATNELEYYEWEDAPKYCSSKISKINDIEFGSNMHLKLINDLNLKPLEVGQLQESLEKLPSIKECLIYPAEFANIEENNVDEELENIENVDILISELLNSMDIENINKNDLVSLYRSL
jgi:hypothetical protein